MQVPLWLQSWEFWSYVSIPIGCALIGWITNWLAIRMTFAPLQFIGIPPYFGWQGVIPRNANRIASKAVDLITTKLISTQEVFDRIDPHVIAEEIEPVLEKITEQIVEEIIVAQSPTLWEMMPNAVKEEIYTQVKNETPALIDRIFKDYRENIDDLFDLRGLVLRNFTGPNIKLLNEMFQKCGEAEFRFIIWSGLVVGFLMGLIQAALWFFFSAWWLLPIVGVVVGFFTNWLAIKMIFRPLYPRKLLFFSYQGLFLKRQAVVSKHYAEIVANKILIPSQIIDTIISGNRADDFVELIQSHVKRAIDSKTNLFKGVILFAFGTQQYRRMKDHATEKIIELIPKYSEKVEDYWGNAMAIEDTLHTRLASLPPPEFEKILHTCFEEDEIKLLLVGAALGFSAGLIQAIFLGAL